MRTWTNGERGNKRAVTCAPVPRLWHPTVWLSMGCGTVWDRSRHIAITFHSYDEVVIHLCNKFMCVLKPKMSVQILGCQHLCWPTNINLPTDSGIGAPKKHYCSPMSKRSPPDVCTELCGYRSVFGRAHVFYLSKVSSYAVTRSEAPTT